MVLKLKNTEQTFKDNHIVNCPVFCCPRRDHYHKCFTNTQITFKRDLSVHFQLLSLPIKNNSKLISSLSIIWGETLLYPEMRSEGDQLSIVKTIKCH